MLNYENLTGFQRAKRSPPFGKHPFNYPSRRHVWKWNYCLAALILWQYVIREEVGGGLPSNPQKCGCLLRHRTPETALGPFFYCHVNLLRVWSFSPKE